MKLSQIMIIYMVLLSILLLPRAGHTQAATYVQLRMLEVPSQSLADSIIVRYNRGESFQHLAMQHAIDPSGAQANWMALDKLAPEFADLLRSISEGSVSAAIPRGSNFLILQKVKELPEAGYLRFQIQKTQMDSLLSQIKRDIGNADKTGAQTHLSQARLLLAEFAEPVYRLPILDLEGTLLLREGRYTDAIAAYRQLLSASSESSARHWQQNAYRGMGLAWQYLNNYSRAVTCYDSAMALARESGDRVNAGILAGNLGTAYDALGRYENALQAYSQALRIARESEDKRNESIWLNGRGQTYRNLGSYARALSSYDSALSIAHELGDLSVENVSLGGMGQTLAAGGRDTESLRKLTAALKIARQIGDRFNEGVWLGSIGQSYKGLSDSWKAIAYYDSALVIARETGNTFYQGVWLGNTGLAHYALGNYPRSLTLCDSALKIARQIGDRFNEGVWLGSIGQTEIALGDMDAAVAYYDSAFAIARDIGDRRGQGARLGDLGQIYLDLGEYEKSAAHYRNALLIARQIGDRFNEGVWLGSIGQIYDAQTEYSSAIACYDSALVLARQIGDRQNEGVWLGSAGKSYKMQANYARAIDYFESALVIARDIDDKESIWRHYWNLATAQAHSAESSPHEIIALFEDAINALENITGELVKDAHKRAYLENKQGLYDDYISYLMRLPEARHHERALEISEASRARALKDLLQGQRIQAPLSVERRLAAQKRSEELTRSRPASQQTLAVDAGSSSRFATVEDWAAQIAIPPDTLGSSEGAAEIRLREIRSEATEHTLLMYHILPDGIAMWAVTPQGKIYSHQQQGISADSLYSLILSARLALGLPVDDLRGARPLVSAESPVSSYEPVLRSLNTMLIEPLAKYLPRDSTDAIVILPHEILFLLPFSCLINPDGQYLVQQYSFSTSPSVGLLKFTRGRIREQQGLEAPKLLLMGNPLMPDPALWAPLPGAEVEVLEIADHVNSKKGAGFQQTGAMALQALPLIRERATEAEFRDIGGVQSIIHLATHAYLASNPLRCGIILGKTGTRMESDGILTTGEIFTIPLNADLIVLSACETGLGQISSDGVTGLSRAFLYAGAESMIASLWQVPDEATQELMIKFYEELARDGNKARALRAAQLHTLKNHPHPRDWAAFMLIGQGS